MTPKTVELKVTRFSPKQKVLNLDTNEETEIVVSSDKYELPEFDSKVWASEDEFLNAAFEVAKTLVTPLAKQVDALLYRATQDSYQAGKTEALSKGNFLTSDLKSKIVGIMKGNNAYAELSAKDCYDTWIAGYKAKKAGAVKVLKMAQDLADLGEM